MVGNMLVLSVELLKLQDKFISETEFMGNQMDDGIEPGFWPMSPSIFDTKSNFADETFHHIIGPGYFDMV